MSQHACGTYLVAEHLRRGVVTAGLRHFGHACSSTAAGVTECKTAVMYRKFIRRYKRRALQQHEGAFATKKPRADDAMTVAASSSSTGTVRAPLQLRESIELTPQEQQLFEFLLDVEKQYECSAVLRVAGGWVRDKLLGRDSDDVDIVIDTMKGKEFADLINTYERDHGHKQHPVGVIKANPDQSKHLETATMQLGDIGWVDFVNLRAETYSEDHRIPDIEFGTPLQDAQRRDFTINSLFYNVAERKVEDFTEQGVSDLRHGILRTPLDPRVTFLDDPLRVMRAVRFASRFDLQLDDTLRAAVELDEVKEALIKKVSRERVGKELVSMLVGSSAHPARALRLIHELQLCRPIFLPPLEQPIFQRDGTIAVAVGEGWATDDAVWTLSYAYAAKMYDLIVVAGDDVSKLAEEEQTALKLRILASFLLPFADHYVLEKNRQVALPTFIIRELLKLRNRDAVDVGNAILKNVAALQALTHTTAAFSRVGVGLFLREIKSLWELCRDVALVKELVECDSEEQRATTSQRYHEFSNKIVEFGLVGVWDLKSLLNVRAVIAAELCFSRMLADFVCAFQGNELVKELQVKPGPSIKQMLDKIMIWQLENPDKTRDECLAHFKEVVASADSK
ncbi:putative Trna nucleotidyltransferase, partial [Globisporangium splendens]